MFSQSVGSQYDPKRDLIENVLLSSNCLLEKSPLLLIFKNCEKVDSGGGFKESFF